MTGESGLRTGDWVEVRSKQEILATLDQNGRLDELPFMPEMLRFCGQRLRVFKRAHKTCDTVNKTGGRRLVASVHLEDARCDGAAHGGCQAACLIFWKQAWLKPVPDRRHTVTSIAASDMAGATGCAEESLTRATQSEGSNDASDPTYVCQATQLPAATTLLPWWDVRQYLEDYTSGNVTLGRMVSSFTFSAYNQLINLGIGLGAPLRWLYDRFQAVTGGVPYPVRRGRVPAGTPTPTVSLGLQPGEWVRVKAHSDILETLDASSKNRGMYFDCEEVPYCGGDYRVGTRVERIINEKTGKMMRFQNASVILDRVYCQARYSQHRLFCPRAIYPMWREIWLERIDVMKATPPRGPGNS